MRSIEVLAAVIQDTRGRILLTRRTEGRDLAGRWEFPGGKREPGETPEAALVRELDEELGIQVEVGEHLITVPQRYPGKRLTLDVRRVGQWTGHPRGMEGQAMVWVPPHKLASYEMPPADRPVVAVLDHPDRYLVTPPPADDDPAWLDALGRALEAGIRLVQLRAPGLEPARWDRLVEQAAALCGQWGARVLVNGDAELAQRHGTGLHLPARELMALAGASPTEDLAGVVPGGRGALPRPLAASCHRVEEVRAAKALGCDFAVVGHVADTPSHPGDAPIGWDGFARLREEVDLPLFAIGGLGTGDHGTARRHGAQGIAAIRAFWP
ncbi:Nudix family hydrolase [Lysobacter sp. GX 14042]|uniref:Nudix family hydrolase n=1 Tax=Lysobacter sp. GX 14042 TaxID=2907155 RepID=UPI001F1DF079|nr:Nudix family hydrolase [Lysobacter sp. GX 14042]MCE7031191.1 Nudix family hydrolase [Lysobacter sp. GX 14042]